MRSLGENVRERRKALEQTQEQTAYLAGINSKFLQRIEDGQSQPTAFNLVRLAEALDTRITELVAEDVVREPLPHQAEIARIRKLLMGASDEVASLAVRLVAVAVEAERTR
jgi:transcriptional regulator with XRE-family HTH domain